MHPLRVAFFVRKDSDMKSIADLKGRRVPVGYSAMRTIDALTNAVLATAGLTPADVKPVLVPNVVRGADDFVSGNADVFMFAFGGAKVREVDATVGGMRVLEIPEAGMPRQPQDLSVRLSERGQSGPAFIGVTQKMKVYSYDNMLFTNAKVTDDIVYKIDRDHGEQQAPTSSPCSRRCASSPPPASTSNTTSPITRAR